MDNQPRLFDLNIEEVLDHWEVEHAIRDVIANALDEQLLTGSDDIKIFEDDRGVWHVRDFGRGLQIEHFTLNENKEKLASQLPVIGKFGVGLKDALATLHRRGIGVTITSPYGTFVLREAHKHNFDAITTLHVEQLPAVQMAGTDVALDGVSAADIAARERCSSASRAMRRSRRPSTGRYFAAARGPAACTSRECSRAKSPTSSSLTTLRVSHPR